MGNDYKIIYEDVRLDEVKDLIALLEKSLTILNINGANGIALSAPQLGINKKAAIIRVNNFSLNLINSNIDVGFYKCSFNNESTVTDINKSFNTERFKEIVVSNMVYPKRFIATGIIAVAIQQQIDFFNHITLQDRINNE